MCNKKRSLAAYSQTNPFGDIPFSVFCGHRMLGSGVLAKLFKAARNNKEKANSERKHQKFLSFEGQTHVFRDSVSTECMVARIEAGEFVQQILIASARTFGMREVKRTKPGILCAQNAHFTNAHKNVLSG